MELFYVPPAILPLANFHLYLSLQQIQALEFSCVLWAHPETYWTRVVQTIPKHAVGIRNEDNPPDQKTRLSRPNK